MPIFEKKKQTNIWKIKKLNHMASKKNEKSPLTSGKAKDSDYAATKFWRPCRWWHHHTDANVSTPPLFDNDLQIVLTHFRVGLGCFDIKLSCKRWNIRVKRGGREYIYIHIARERERERG